MNAQTKIPEHQAVYERLRDMILLGRFSPGDPLTILGLTATLGAGMTPVREALRRLTAERALSTLGNRRIIVPDLSTKDIHDLFFLRLRVEPELARRAVSTLTRQDINELEQIDDSIDTAIEQGNVEAYLELNNRFHFKIYEAAQSPVLFGVAQSLWVQVGPSLRIVSGRYGTANLPDKHVELIEAFRARDREAADKAMVGDLHQSLLLVTANAPEKNDQNKMELS